ncbi:hypothetical protein HDU87_008262 [Geranomyces variabilis]|uniref:Uncharacterized protein n=1 Tax=Geranomyces variabilis TaxID=109894 RepID=A0AAD5XMS7_9FUNG|nr:hypothetical protein HDU87_008262 [Geranomyces variabilis]
MQLNAVLLAALLATTAQAHPLKKCKATTTIVVPIETILPIATPSSAPDAYPFPTVTGAEPTSLPTAVESPDSTTAVEIPQTTAAPTAVPAPSVTATALPVYPVQATKDDTKANDDAAATAAEAKKAADAAATAAQGTEAPAGAAGKKPIVASFLRSEEFKVADAASQVKNFADNAAAKVKGGSNAKAKAAAAAAAAKAKAAAAAKAKAAAAKAKAAAQAAAEKTVHSIGAFFGTQSGIGSWFRADNGQDDTSGRSWCGYSYKDYTNGFAPDISQMTGGTNAVYGNPMWAASAKKFCGLEAEVTNPHTGVKMNMYIVDAFDHSWVRSPGSIDVMVQSWEKLTGRRADSKETVIQGLQWKLTGRRMPKYSFGGSGDQ